MIANPRFPGCHRSKFLWYELCTIQLQSGPDKCGHRSGSHHNNTALPTVTVEENERRDGGPDKGEVSRSWEKDLGYFWTDKTTGIHYSPEWMKIGTNFL